MCVCFFSWFFLSGPLSRRIEKREKINSDSKSKVYSFSYCVFICLGVHLGFSGSIFFVLLFSAERAGERKQTELKTNSFFLTENIFSVFQFFLFICMGCVSGGFPDPVFIRFFSASFFLGFSFFFPSFSAERAGEKKKNFFC